MPHWLADLLLLLSVRHLRSDRCLLLQTSDLYKPSSYFGHYVLQTSIYKPAIYRRHLVDKNRDQAWSDALYQQRSGMLSDLAGSAPRIGFCLLEMYNARAVRRHHHCLYNFIPFQGYEVLQSATSDTKFSVVLTGVNIDRRIKLLSYVLCSNFVWQSIHE